MADADPTERALNIELDLFWVSDNSTTYQVPLPISLRTKSLAADSPAGFILVIDIRNFLPAAVLHDKCSINILE